MIVNQCVSKRDPLGEVNLDLVTVVGHSHGCIKLSSLCSKISSDSEFYCSQPKYGLNLLHIFADVHKQKGPMRLKTI